MKSSLKYLTRLADAKGNTEPCFKESLESIRMFEDFMTQLKKEDEPQREMIRRLKEIISVEDEVLELKKTFLARSKALDKHKSKLRKLQARVHPKRNEITDVEEKIKDDEEHVESSRLDIISKSQSAKVDSRDILDDVLLELFHTHAKMNTGFSKSIAPMMPSVQSHLEKILKEEEKRMKAGWIAEPLVPSQKVAEEEAKEVQPVQEPQSKEEAAPAPAEEAKPTSEAKAEQTRPAVEAPAEEEDADLGEPLEEPEVITPAAA